MLLKNYHMRKISLLILLLVTISVTTKANNISLYSGDVQFNVPEDYKEIAIPQNNNIGYYAESGDKAIALFTYRNGNFDISKVLDSCLCDLTKYDLVESETDFFLNLTTDYATRKYVSENGQRFASHTRYVTQGAYCFGFWYTSEEEFEEFEKLIESIHFAEEEGWNQISLTIKYSIWAIILIGILLILSTMFAGAGGSKEFCTSVSTSFSITVIIALVFLIPMWHFWVAYLALLALFFVACFVCAFFGFYLTFDAD